MNGFLQRKGSRHLRRYCTGGLKIPLGIPVLVHNDVDVSSVTESLSQLQTSSARRGTASSPTLSSATCTTSAWTTFPSPSCVPTDFSSRRETPTMRSATTLSTWTAGPGSSSVSPATKPPVRCANLRRSGQKLRGKKIEEVPRRC